MANLLERDDVLAQLRSLVRSVRPGAGRVVLLRGEAGVGKTTVLGRFVSELDPRMMLLRGWCDALAVPRPLGPLIDALAGLGDAGSGLAAALQAGDTAELYRQLVALLRDGHRWVWVIEDIHWSDAATLDLMRFLARRIESLPLLLVMSYRDDEIGPQHPLAVALGDLSGCPLVDRIAVRPLSAAAVSTLATGSGVNAERLYDLTGGNPFFVTEVLAVGPEALTREALPRSVSEAVWGRLARLSESARDTAYAAAVCGPRASIELLENVYPPATNGALVECLASGVLLADADVVWFRHELARRATLEQMPEFQRRALHQRAMVALAESPDDVNALAALVFHADQAGDRDAVLRHGPVAAERAAGLGAHREAAELYALVLAHAGDIPASQLVQWLERHAFENYLCGLGAVAVSSW